MNGMDGKEIFDMGRTAPGTAFDSGTQREMTAEEKAAAQAAEDQAIAAKAAAEEAQLKAEAEALRAEESAPMVEVYPLTFDTSETGYDLPQLIDMVKNGATLIFGAAGLSLPSVAPQATSARDWTVTGSRLEFSGSFTMLIGEGVPVTADSVALADGPDGPVRSVSALGNTILLSPGDEFQFSAGAFVFEGVQL